MEVALKHQSKQMRLGWYQARHDRLREVRRGFPIKTPFASLDEVDEYLGQPTIACLLCGNEFQQLPRHLRYIHNVTADEYKTRYKIPYTRGLLAAPAYEKAAEVGRQLTKRMGKDHFRLKGLPVANAKPHRKALLYRLNNRGPDGAFRRRT